MLNHILQIFQINKSDKLSHKMKVLIEKSNLSYPYWGWKDPRTCLTAMHWAQCYRGTRSWYGTKNNLYGSKSFIRISFFKKTK